MITMSYWLTFFIVKWPPSKKILRPIEIRMCCECVTKWSIHSSYCFSLGLFFLLSLLFFCPPFLFFSFFFLLYYFLFFIISFLELWVLLLSLLFLIVLYKLVIILFFFEKFRLNLSESFLYNKLQEFTINYWNSYTYSPFFLLCRLQCIFVY